MSAVDVAVTIATLIIFGGVLVALANMWRDPSDVLADTRERRQMSVQRETSGRRDR